jgi:hypothetical protein
MKKTIIHTATAMFVAIATSASASTVFIDWSTSASTPGGADSNGNHWNSLNPGATDLLGSDGVATTWDVTTAILDNPGSGDDSGFGGTGINGPTGSAPFDQSFAVIDGIYSQSASGFATISFSDLDLSSVYNFSAIGGRNSGGIDGNIEVTTGTGTGGTLLNDGTILDFSVTSDASGVIVLKFAGPDSGQNATFNALSITSVPEPSTTALLGLGGLALILRRHK